MLSTSWISANRPHTTFITHNWFIALNSKAHALRLRESQIYDLPLNSDHTIKLYILSLDLRHACRQACITARMQAGRQAHTHRCMY